MNTLLDQLVVYNSVKPKTRLGSIGDGGYVVIDGYDYDFYIGCGIGSNPQFDMQFIRKYPNIKGLVFDGEIEYCMYFSHWVHFVARNIAGENTDHTTNLNEETDPFNNIFIKMDIEGHEWKWLKSFKNLDKVKQIVVEVHGLFHNPHTYDWTKHSNYDYQDVIDGLKKINETHYLVHFHSNNSAEYANLDGKELPTVGELTYIRKRDCLIDGLNKTALPIGGLDFANGTDRHDLKFSEYPFCSK